MGMSLVESQYLVVDMERTSVGQAPTFLYKNVPILTVTS